MAPDYTNTYTARVATALEHVAMGLEHAATAPVRATMASEDAAPGFDTPLSGLTRRYEAGNCLRRIFHCNTRDDDAKPKERMASTFQTRSPDRLAPVHDIERGDLGLTELPRAETSRLVVATYNIRYGVGSHLIGGSLLRRVGLGWPGRRPRLVGHNIQKAARILTDGRSMPRADLIALQEADRGTLRAGGQDVARGLAEAAEMNYIRAHVPTPVDVEPKDRKWWLDFEERMQVGERGDTGVAILSRLPLADAARIELPSSECLWRPRLALAASVPFGERTLHVFNSHIDTHANVEGQLAQHRTVLALAERVGERGPTILLGDFNTITHEARLAARALLESRGYTTPLPTGTATWRSGPLRYHFDWIFTRGVRVLRWGVARVTGVSDHWPVWVEIEPEQSE